MSEYRISEAAGVLGVSVKAARRMIASGELPSAKKSGHIIVTEHDITEFSAAHGHTKINVSSSGTTPCHRACPVLWTDISGNWKDPEKSGMTFVDLFCGAGR